MHIIKSSKLFIQNFTLSTALQSPLERVAFTTFRLPLKYRFSLNQAKRMSAFRSRFDQLLYEHFYDARVLSGCDDVRTLDLPSAPATASAHGYALSPRGYEPRPVHGLFASQKLGQPACPRNEAPAELPITSPAAIAGHSASH